MVLSEKNVKDVVELAKSTGGSSDRTPAKATIGEYSRVVLRVDDVRATCRELSGKGVRFDGQPFESDGGVFATMRDPWANLFILADDTRA